MTMTQVIAMPKLGLSMTEGVISQWLKNEGDRVTKGEELVEIETDKITNVVEAPADGYLRLILLKVGETGLVKAPIGIIAEEDEDISEWTTASSEVNENIVQKNKEQTKNMNVNDDENADKTLVNRISSEVLATPAAKYFAREHGFSIEGVVGTGPKKQIHERDVIAFYENWKKPVKLTPTAKKAVEELQFNESDLVGRDSKRVYLEDLESLSKNKKPQNEKRVPLNGIRRAIAAKMSDSWKEIPHVTLHKKVDITHLMSLNETYLNTSSFQEKGKKVTFTHQLIKACAIALNEFRQLNSSMGENEIIYHENINIGVATSTDQGLLVPVISNCEEASMKQIVQTLNELVKLAREQTLNPDHISGGTFTITNLGMYGIDYFTPIINLPESAILGVGKITQTESKFEVYFSLSFDHRIIDGVEAALFLKKLENLLQEPMQLFI